MSLTSPAPWLAWRNRRDLTQTALAALVGSDASTIAKIEAGDRSPSTRLLWALADKLSLSDEERLLALRLAAEHVAVPQPPPPAA